jgi:predicted phage terminase large subunit-like protein
VRAWDLAATVADGSNDPDWTVGIKLQAEPQGRYAVLDVVRVRDSPHGVVETIAATAKRDGHGVRIGLPEDPGQAGKTQIAFLSAALNGYRVKSSPETGAKATRVMPVASQIEARNFSIVRATWNHAFLEELCDFPNSRKDDQVDALSRAFSMLINTDAPARHLNLPFISR